MVQFDHDKNDRPTHLPEVLRGCHQGWRHLVHQRIRPAQGPYLRNRARRHRKGLAFEDEDAYTNPEINEHGQAIEAVLTYEIAIYVFRRLNGPWGEVLDELYRLRSSKINEYREATGYNIDTENEFD